MSTGKLAVVTGASTGIGLELARLCAAEGHDLVICSDEAMDVVAKELREAGAKVEEVRTDLATEAGVDALLRHLEGRRVDYLFANAGVGLGHAFLEQDWPEIRRVIDLNVTFTTYLLHRLGRRLKEQGSGRILITGSIAGLMPGSFLAVYNATKAYVDSLSYAMRNELQDSGVTVSCLMPGPTDTAFFQRAGMEDTPVGGEMRKDDPAMVARKGYEAMMKGQSGVVTGFMNKLQATFAGIIPDTVLARMHRRLAEPER